jgi:hypothetical protein
MAISLKQALSTLPDRRTQVSLTAAFASQIAAENSVATRQLSADETGLVLFLNQSSGFVVTLPLPAKGLRYEVICATAPSGGSYTVVTANSANIIKGLQTPVDGTAGDFGTADDTVTFVAAQAVAGDKVEFFSDGTSWFAYAVSKVAAGITFTQAS